MAAPIYISTNSVPGFPFLPKDSSICDVYVCGVCVCVCVCGVCVCVCVSVLMKAILTGWVIAHCGFDLLFTDD